MAVAVLVLLGDQCAWAAVGLIAGARAGAPPVKGDLETGDAVSGNSEGVACFPSWTGGGGGGMAGKRELKAAPLGVEDSLV